MALVFPAVEYLGTAFKVFGAVTVEGVVQGDSPFLQGRSQRNQLEGGAGLIAIGHGPVSPLGQTGRSQRVIIGIHGFLVLSAALSVSLGSLIDFFQFGHGIFIVDFQIIVGVVCTHGGHAENLAGVDVGHDAKRTVEHIIFFNGRLQVLLKIILHRGVDGQDQTVSIGGIVVFFIVVEHFRTQIALGGDDLTGGALQIAVVIGFDAFRAHIILPGKAQNLGTQGTVGIGPLGIRLQVDALDRVFIDKVPDLLGQIRVNFAADDLIPHFGVGGLFVDKTLLHVQNLRQSRSNQIQVLLLRGDLVRVDKDVLHRHRLGQYVHVAVVNDAPLRRQGRAAGLVGNGHLFIFVVIQNHQLEQRPDQGHKCQCHQQRDDHGPAQNSLAGPLAGVLMGLLPLTVFVCHVVPCLSVRSAQTRTDGKLRRPCSSDLMRRPEASCTILI